MIFACKRCKFLFQRTAETVVCPSCGRDTVLPADEQEQEAYLNGNPPTEEENS